jgi:hypothetical protein
VTAPKLARDDARCLNINLVLPAATAVVKAWWAAASAISSASWAGLHLLAVAEDAHANALRWATSIGT